MSDERPKVFIVVVDYGYEGISRNPESFIVFMNEENAKDFVRRANKCGDGFGTRVVIPAEFVGFKP